MSAFLSVLSSTMVGLILTAAPWTALWDGNYLLHAHPLLRAALLSSFTRGAVSGLGLVNLLLALHEARQHLVALPPGPEER
ncbi:MAG: hypothetical protein AB7O37_21195 [Vicinamibacteria bacterium]